MFKHEVLEYYGSVIKAAKAIGVSRQAIYEWGPIIPELWAWKIEGITRRKLKVNEALYEDVA